MGCYTRYDSGLLPYSCEAQPTQVHGLLAGPQAILFQGGPLRFKRCPTSLHVNLQTSPQVAQARGYQTDGVSRRLSNLGCVPRDNTTEVAKSDRTPSITRLPDQSREIKAGASTTPDLVGGPVGPISEHMGRNCLTERGNTLQGKNTSTEGDIHKTRPRVPFWFRGFCSTNTVAGQNRPHQLPSHLETPTRLPQRPPPQTLGVVKGGPTAVELVSVATGTALQSSSSSAVNLDRCVSRGLGGLHLSGRQMLGNLVASPADVAHQPDGTVHNSPGHRSPRREQHVDRTTYRQHNREVSPAEKDNLIQDSTSVLEEPTTIINETEYSLPHSLRSKPPERDRRCTKQGSTTPDRVDSPRGNLPRGSEMEGGGIRSRPHGHEGEHQASNLRSTSSSPRGGEHRRLPDRLEHVETNIYLPPSQVSHGSGSKTKTLRPPRRNNRALEASRALVSRAIRTIKRHSQTKRPSPAESKGPTVPERVKDLRTLDRFQFLKKYLQLEMKEEVALTILAAHRQSSIKQMEVAWKKFQKWLPQNKTSITKGDVLQFLHDQKPLTAQTIRCYKASLAAPLKRAFSINCQGEEFKLLSKGQANSEPKRVRRVPPWSLNHALESIAKGNKNVMKDFIFLKALFLTALACSNRSTDLAHLVRDPIILEGKVELCTREGFMIKNQTSKHKPRPISFPHLARDDPLCPASAIKDYITYTGHLNHENFLFVNPKTGKNLTAGRLQYWLVKAIKTFDTSGQGLAHDLRKAGTSLAYVRGTPLQDILEAGFWSSPEVFISRYLTQTTVPSRSCIAARQFISVRVPNNDNNM